MDVSDAGGGTLHYAWRTTDGTLASSDAPTATWTLPAGPGLHFAYVLVRNGMGGYTERRVAVSTDGEPASRAAAPRVLAPPSAPARSGHPVSSFANAGTVGPPPTDPNLYALVARVPDVYVALRDTSTGATTPAVTTGLTGAFAVPDVPAGSYDVMCSLDGVSYDVCATPLEVTDHASLSYGGVPAAGQTAPAPWVMGTLLLEDGSACGTLNHFFGVEVAGRATLLDAGLAPLGPTRRVNVFGQYALPYRPGAAYVRLACEGAPPALVPVPPGASAGDVDLGQTVLAGVRAPAVAGMAAIHRGAQVGVFLPPPSGLPSDAVAFRDQFLAYKGSDTRQSACRYYRAIGAVESCDAEGRPAGALRFDDWKRAVGLDPFARDGKHDVTATYVNEVDLNLTRNHHALSYGRDRAAAYVCNHLGPAQPTRAAVDAAVDDAVHGRKLVACVAMDHLVHPGVNGGKAFTRFLIFGPSGELLQSVNLDGRGEKFAPGVCVACHGGDDYAGPFAGGSSDIGAHFLPYDSGNFAFSSASGLSGPAQAGAIRALNTVLLDAGPNAATSELVAGWYASGSDVLDDTYLPVSWRAGSDEAQRFYHGVYARSCRTCHVAFSEEFNFDHYQNVATGFLSSRMCGGTAYVPRGYSMPNSRVTFDRFWNEPPGGDSQATQLARFVNDGDLSGNRCVLPICTTHFQVAARLPVLAPTSVAVADLDGDFLLDLAVTSYAMGAVLVFLGNGDGAFRAAGAYEVGAGPSAVVAAFLDANGFLDLAVANRESHNVSLLLGNGDGTFQPQVLAATASTATSLGVAYPGTLAELVVGSDAIDLLTLLAVNADGTFGAATEYAAGYPAPLAVGAFQGRFAADVAVANAATGDVSVFLRAGAALAPAVRYGAGDGPAAVVAGDLEYRGVNDLIVANATAGSVTVLRGNGDGSFQAGVELPAGPEPIALAQGDLDGDGRMDIAVAGASGELGYLPGNGDGSFRTRVAVPTAELLPISLAAADLDDDGVVDLVGAFQGSDAVVLLRGRCSPP